jgi:hypothetical protein
MSDQSRASELGELRGYLRGIGESAGLPIDVDIDDIAIVLNCVLRTDTGRMRDLPIATRCRAAYAELLMRRRSG